jgi:hypothetical protein
MARFDILGLQYFTDGGDLLGGGKLNFYETGTTTRKNTFSDAGMTIANTNPVTLDADGRAPNIFFSGLAKCVLTDSTGAVLETRDPVGDTASEFGSLWLEYESYNIPDVRKGSDNLYYESIVDNNLNNNPVTTSGFWRATTNLSTSTVDGTNAVGFRTIPQNSQSAAYELVLTDSGKHILHPSADTTARTFTIPSNASVAFPIGTAVTFINENGTGGIVTIAITTDTMRLAELGTTGSRTLARNGVATAIKITATSWIISGVGLT